MNKHLEPRQLPTLPRAATREKSPSRTRWLLTLATIVVGVGALGTWLMPTKHADQVTQREIDARQAQFAPVHAVSLPSIAGSAIDQALDSMQLAPAERARLRELVMAGDATPSSQAQPARSAVRLVSVTLWDTHDQDGDVVTVSSAGYRRDITLTNAPLTVSFPVDGSSSVQFVGVHDGGGGITLGIRGPNQEFLMPIMSEGQALSLPVTN